MAKLQAYQSQVGLGGSYSGLKASAQDFDTGGGLGAVLKGAAQLGQMVIKKQEDGQIRQAQNDAINTRVAMTQQLADDTLSGVAAEDGYVDRLRDQLEARQAESAEGMTTQRTRDAQSDVFTKLQADILSRGIGANAQGRAKNIVVDHGEFMEDGVNTLLTDPTQFEAIKEDAFKKIESYTALGDTKKAQQLDSDLEKLRDAQLQGRISKGEGLEVLAELKAGEYDIPPDRRKKLQALAKSENRKQEEAAVMSSILINPEATIAKIKSGELRVTESKDKVSLLNTARIADDNRKKQAKVDVKEERKRVVRETENEILVSSLDPEVDKKALTAKILASELEITRKEHWLKVISPDAANYKTDLTAYRNTMIKVQEQEITDPIEIYKMIGTPQGLSQTDANRIVTTMKTVNDTPNAKKLISRERGFVSKRVTQGNMFGTLDPDVIEREHAALVLFDDLLNKGVADGVPLEEMLDPKNPGYIPNIVARSFPQPGLEESLKSQLNQLRNFQRPKGNEPLVSPREPGESINQYLSRTRGAK